MYTIDLDRPCRVYFIGIGGSSMSGLAEFLYHYGFDVSGSDRDESKYTRKLRGMGMTVHIGQKAENVPEGLDAVVYTAAVHADNPEYARAAQMGLPLINRAVLLGQIMKAHHKSAAISGTHGKTTTSAMTVDILLHAGMDPSVSIGGVLDSIGGNSRVGSRETFVAEACEFTNSFLEMYPEVAAVLNIEEDHLDFFKDLDDIRHSFREFLSHVPEGGTAVIGAAIDRWQELVEGLPCRVVTFGEGGDITARDLVYDEEGRGSFLLCLPGEEPQPVRLAVSGAHNVLDALAAAGTCQAMGVPADAIAEGLNAYTGARRRFEKKGVLNGVEIYDDYGHHPTELKVTLEVAALKKKGRVWAVFQPFTYSRTKFLFEDFAQVLTLADEVVLTPIMGARETDTLGMDSEQLAARVRELGTSAIALPSFDAAEDYLFKKCEPGDLLITMGCGDAYKIGEALLSR